MPQCREAKEAGHVTFQDNLEEYTIPEGSWSVRPLLGYDWIAGLLETDSSVSEKSEQYFAELQEFRLVNKEACVYEQCLEPEALDYLAPEQDVDLVPTSHQCIYCFRLNKRLFPVPVDSASACPICKTPRAQRPPETLEEPAYIRVSIPRATLLPAHKYKIHRRKSFEAADNLALPSHCLVGWENVIPFGSPTMSSLDLRTSLEEKPTDPFPSELGIQTSIICIRMKTLKLVIDCFGLIPGDQLFHWNSWQPWVCMCEQYKQARIRYFVVWAENITVKPKASEFWQEKPCFLRDCSMCKPEECPSGPRISDFLPQLEHLSVSGFSNTDSPPLGTPDFKSYDSLPVVDDIGEE
ncbi:migration and invasion-inhibitory protein [Alligator mississippiensis]|uniref:Migration and invasion-inhibitory protein n=1 Tax=Alligator mississippiensis TaxID=8496 RepID=A0A151N3Q6_ALLMI|nr:migration and invasion-inhibitory protein [Alligator mississippiensis]